LLPGNKEAFISIKSNIPLLLSCPLQGEQHSKQQNTAVAKQANKKLA